MRNIDVMLSRAGIYVVMTHAGATLVEVDQAGTCYQLEPASGRYARDGELAPGGWFLQHVASIHGPFARTAHTAAPAEA